MCKAQLRALVRSKPGEDVVAWTAPIHCTSLKYRFGQLPYFVPCTAGIQASLPMFAHAAIASYIYIADTCYKCSLNPARYITAVCEHVQADPWLLPGRQAVFKFSVSTTWCSTYMSCCIAPFPLSIKQPCLVVNAHIIQPVLCFPCRRSPQIGQQAWSHRVFERTDHTQAQTRENPQFLGVPWDCACIICVVPYLEPKSLRARDVAE